MIGACVGSPALQRFSRSHVGVWRRDRLFGSLFGAQDPLEKQPAQRCSRWRNASRCGGRSAFIIEIGVASRDPVKAARLANAVAHA
jgi:hypothetical protein